MTRDEQTPDTEAANEPAAKKPYSPPKLVKYGEVRSLTQTSTGGSAEPSGMFPSKANSSRDIKQDIVRIGTHPLGFGLYVFRYRPEHREACGHGRQFGVMADEVSAVAPHAVSSNEIGQTVVDYEMIGIRRPLGTRPIL
jgi:hypothetical protein